MAESNLLLDGLIEAAGLSHAGLAARINTAGALLGLRYDHASVARWIRDGAIPRHPAPELICGILGERLGRTMTAADIGMVRRKSTDSIMTLGSTVEQAKALWRADHLGRAMSENRHPMSGAAAVAPLFEWENPPADLRVANSAGQPVGDAEIAFLLASRRHYEEMYRRVGGIPVRQRIVKLLHADVAPMLAGRYNDATGRLLYRAVGGLVAMAGICAYDAARQGQALAQRYFFHALRMAKASGDKAFGGYVAALLTNQAIFLGEHRLAIQYAETALRAGRNALTPALRTDLHAMQAKAYAQLGERASCYAQMKLAEQAAQRIVLVNEPPETSYVQPGLIEVQHSEALGHVGDLATAQRFAEESLVRVTHARGRAHRLANLSIVLTARREIDHGVDIARRALAGVTGMESWRVRNHVEDAIDRLRPYAGLPDVDDLLEQAHAVLGRTDE